MYFLEKRIVQLKIFHIFDTDMKQQSPFRTNIILNIENTKMCEPACFIE